MIVKSILQDSSIKGKIIYKTIDVSDSKIKTSIPIVIVKGVKKGPVLGVICMQHGLEINGMEVMRRVIERLNPRKMSGSLICVSTANPLAASARKQAYPTDKKWDSGRPFCDMGRLWPGNSNGNITERIVRVIRDEVVANVDYLIDLHSHETCYGPVVLCLGDKRNLRFGRSLGLKKIHVSSIRDYKGKRKKILTVYIGRHLELPCSIIELPPLRMLNEESIKTGIKAVKNALVYAKIIEGSLNLPPYRVLIGNKYQNTLYQADFDGVFIKRKNAGDIVNKGDMIGTVYSFKGYNIVQKIVSPCDNMLIVTLGNRPLHLPEFETDMVKSGEYICKLTKDYKKIVTPV